MATHTVLPNEIDKLGHVINLSEAYLKKQSNKKITEQDWLGDADYEKITYLLDEKNGLLKGQDDVLSAEMPSQHDIMGLIKHYFRRMPFSEGIESLIDAFCTDIKNIRSVKSTIKREEYQAAMQGLIDELIEQHEFKRAFCLHEILHLTHISLNKEKYEQDDTVPEISPVIASVFQEAFGQKNNVTLLPAFFEAFSVIVQDSNYLYSFDSVYPHLSLNEDDKESVEFENIDITSPLTLEDESALENSIIEHRTKGREDKKTQGTDTMFLKTRAQPTAKNEKSENRSINPERLSEKPNKSSKTNDNRVGVVSSAKEKENDFDNLSDTSEYATKVDRIKSVAKEAVVKAKAGWRYTKPKLVDFWNYAYPKTKQFIVWAWPKVKFACVKVWHFCIDSTNYLIKKIKSRHQSKK